MKDRKRSKKQSESISVLAKPAFSNRTGNPYNWLLYTNLEKLGVKVVDYSKYRLLNQKWDIMHVHWPVNVVRVPQWRRASYKTLNLSIALTLARTKGAKIVWTVHNLETHEKYHPKLQNYFTDYFIKRVDGFISLSATANELVRSRYPVLRKVPSVVVPHGHYRDVYPNYVTKKEARNRLGIEAYGAKVILFLGRISSYKNIPSLIRTFHSLKDTNAMLLIAGKPATLKLERQIAEMAANDPERIRLHLGFVPEEDIQFYFKAGDLVALPYHDFLNSGSAVLALSYSVPILVPSKGSFKDLQSVVGKEWVRMYDEVLSSEELRYHLDYVSRNMTDRYLPLKEFAWDEIALKTLEFYKGLVCK